MIAPPEIRLRHEVHQNMGWEIFQDSLSNPKLFSIDYPKHPHRIAIYGAT
jgi:hypothetical protein